MYLPPHVQSCSYKYMQADQNQQCFSPSCSQRHYGTSHAFWQIWSTREYSLLVAYHSKIHIEHSVCKLLLVGVKSPPVKHVFTKRYSQNGPQTLDCYSRIHTSGKVSWWFCDVPVTLRICSVKVTIPIVDPRHGISECENIGLWYHPPPVLNSLLGSHFI